MKVELRNDFLFGGELYRRGIVELPDGTILPKSAKIIVEDVQESKPPLQPELPLEAVKGK